MNKKKLKRATTRWYASAQGRARSLFTAARWRAKKKGLPFDLTVEWIGEALAHGKCQRTGIAFSLNPISTAKNVAPFAPSLDRRDSRGGYTQDNVEVVVAALNIARNEWGDGIFELVARAYLANSRA